MFMVRYTMPICTFQLGSFGSFSAPETGDFYPFPDVRLTKTERNSGSYRYLGEEALGSMI
jgi:hypothetical protein